MTSMDSTSSMPSMIAALDTVAGRIRDRYDNPSRKAFTYLFRLMPGSPMDADTISLVPAAEHVLSAWVDEGDGLLPAPVAAAIARCEAARTVRPHDAPAPAPAPGQSMLSATARKQMMARVILFTVQPVDSDRIVVHLWSRALGFSPKGDREAHEEWRRAAGDFWYSEYRER